MKTDITLEPGPGKVTIQLRSGPKTEVMEIRQGAIALLHFADAFTRAARMTIEEERRER